MLCFSLAFLFASPDGAHESFAFWLGDRIVATRAVPTTLGIETFSGVGSPYVAAGWLGYVVESRLRLCPIPILDLTQFLEAFGVLGLIAYRASASVGVARREMTAFVTSVLATALVAEPSRRGGELGTWFFGALLAAMPVRANIRTIAVAVFFASVAWANFSVLGALAPIVVLTTQLADGKSWKRSSLLTIVAAAGCLLNPDNVAVFTQAAETLELDRSVMALRPEWPSLVFDSTYAIGLPITLVAVALASWLRRPSIAEALGTLLSIVLMFGNGRYFPFAAIVMVPPIARTLAATIMLKVSKRSTVAFASALLCLVVFLTATEFHRANASVADSNAEVSLARTLALVSGPHRVLCLDARANCDAFVAYSPRIRVFADERAGAYPRRVRMEGLEFRRPRMSWRGELNHERIDALVLETASPLMEIALNGRWAIVARREPLALLLRR